MFFRQPRPRPDLPTSHYFLSISRGEAMRTFMLTPIEFLALVALALAALGFAVTGAFELALSDPAAGALVLRADDDGGAADVADRRREAEADASRALEARVRDIVRRQMSLEKRAAAVAALAVAAHPPPLASGGATGAAPDAVGAIERLAPASGPRRPDAPENATARAYSPPAAALAAPAAPVRAPPGPLGAADGRSQPNPALLAASAGLDPPTRLAFVDRSLDRIETGEMTAVAALDRAAVAGADRNAAILADAGLDAEALLPPRPRPTGGPYVPPDAGTPLSAFDRAAARAARDIAFAEKLETLMGRMPLGRPVAGEAPVTSPFGYRIDPFLGRPALHPGVDLLQAFGSEIRAAGSGRVVHAGLAGGYGLMVEIDHGDGLATRYGHLSEALVAEGDVIARGAVVGRLGSTGRSTGPHLHYEVRIDGDPVDPERFLRAGARLAEAP